MSSIVAEVPQTATPAASRLPFTERGALRILIHRERFLANLTGCFAVIVRPGPPPSLVKPRYFVRTAAFPKITYRGPSASLSLVAHIAAVAVLVYLHPISHARAMTQNDWRASETIYYYRIPLPETAKPPQPVSMAPRRRSSEHRPAIQAPKLQTAPSHSVADLVSKPAHPDNLRQTIYQSASPPDLIIRTEQKLPNVVILQQNQPDLKAPLLQSYARPATVPRQADAPEAPVVTINASPSAAGVIAQLAQNNPRLVIPVAGGGTPSMSNAALSEGPPSNAPDLVVVGIDPGDAKSQLSLPNGNRWGEFSIAPPAQPGAAADGNTGSANPSGKSTAGDGSHGISAAAGTPGPVNMAGARGGAAGMLAPSLSVSLVYPIVQPAIPVRRNTMVISSGPIGGGGLNVYGALNCGKIYSIFLPMPERNWSMQYCDRSSANGKMAPDPQTAVIRLDSPLLPPDPDLQHRYNFKRSPVPPPMANRPIILKGVIGADGTVQQLIVYRGVSPVLDEAARIAFSRWRFRPAMRDGKAVAVDILVGIPPAGGGDYINR